MNQDYNNNCWDYKFYVWDQPDSKLSSFEDLTFFKIK